MVTPATPAQNDAGQDAPRPVLLTGGHDVARLTALAESATDAVGDTAAALRLARELVATLPQPGSGATAELWSALATLASVDLGVARAAEPHLDAVAILAQADRVDLSPLGVDDQSTWGVFAAEGPGARLEASEQDGHWILSGEKPWCSLAGSLSHALVTAWTSDSDRRLFAVRLADVEVLDRPWPSHGLADVPSGPIRCERTPAIPIGEDGWYLRRPGFWWGGCQVAAVWYGGAVGLGRRLVAGSRRRPPDQVAEMLLGRVDVALTSARLALAEAARIVDAPGDADGGQVAARTRLAVHHAAEEVIALVGHGLGPAPLTQEPDHLRRVADLQVYLRQCHAERDEAALGRTLLAVGTEWS